MCMVDDLCFVLCTCSFLLGKRRSFREYGILRPIRDNVVICIYDVYYQSGYAIVGTKCDIVIHTAGEQARGE